MRRKRQPPQLGRLKIQARQPKSNEARRRMIFQHIQKVGKQLPKQPQKQEIRWQRKNQATTMKAHPRPQVLNRAAGQSQQMPAKTAQPTVKKASGPLQKCRQPRVLQHLWLRRNRGRAAQALHPTFPPQSKRLWRMRTHCLKTGGVMAQRR